MHFRFHRKSAKGSEEVEKAMDQLQAQIREEAYEKRLKQAKDKKKKKEKTFLELAKGFWRVNNPNLSGKTPTIFINKKSWLNVPIHPAKTTADIWKIS